MTPPIFSAVCRLGLIAAFALSSCSCDVRPREDIRWVEYSVPALAGSDCSKELLRVLNSIEGVLQANPDLENQRISVQYNSRTLAQKNIEHAIAAGGFDVDETPADAVAKSRLPEGCR